MSIAAPWHERGRVQDRFVGLHLVMASNLSMFEEGLCRIRFEKCFGDLRPSAAFQRLRIHEYSAARCAATYDLSLPCFFEALDGLGQPNSPQAAIGREARPIRRRIFCWQQTCCDG